MFLRGRVRAASLAEVVIAIAVIALCFGVASLVFVRSTRSASNFQDIKKQTEIQSAIWKALHKREKPEEWAGNEFRSEKDEDYSDSLEIIEFTGSDNKVIWQQHWVNE